MIQEVINLVQNFPESIDDENLSILLSSLEKIRLRRKFAKLISAQKDLGILVDKRIHVCLTKNGEFECNTFENVDVGEVNALLAKMPSSIPVNVLEGLDREYTKRIENESKANT